MLMKAERCFFPLHLDSGNRGCEGIARGTIQILGLDKQKYCALESDIANDNITGLSNVVSYYPKRSNKLANLFGKIRRKIIFDKNKKNRMAYEFKYKGFLRRINNQDITFITGGDMLCYDDNEVNYLTEYLHSNGLESVLWGCSVGRENITKEKERILNFFSCITTRESLTYEFLKNELNLKNVFLFPDPAFVLEAEEVELPDYMYGNSVGVNLSNFVSANVDDSTIFGKNIKNLFEYILRNTDLNIVLIPHVFWAGQDDRLVCDYYKNIYKNNNRVYVLESDKLNYCQIRYIISKLKFFIGARTHAMISAYSMCVPSLALGYSIKSRGIAKDVNMPEYTVIDYRELNDDYEIVNKFKMLQNDEEIIRTTLKITMPGYIKKAYDAKVCIDRLIGGE